MIALLNHNWVCSVPVFFFFFSFFDRKIGGKEKDTCSSAIVFMKLSSPADRKWGLEPGPLHMLTCALWGALLHEDLGSTLDITWQHLWWHTGELLNGGASAVVSFLLCFLFSIWSWKKKRRFFSLKAVHFHMCYVGLGSYIHTYLHA